MARTKKLFNAKERACVTKTFGDLRATRDALGVNQAEFWRSVGITQSGGSRFESGRNIPRTVKMLVALRALGRITEEELVELGEMVGGDVA